jgi:hypothetical protein
VVRDVMNGTAEKNAFVVKEKKNASQCAALLLLTRISGYPSVDKFPYGGYVKYT